MTPLVPIALFGWFGVSIGLFCLLTPRSAVFASYMGAVMFLPNAAYSLPGLPTYDKLTSASLSVLLGVLLFDLRKFSNLAPKWGDLFMVAVVVTPFFTSVSNDLGAYDGLSEVFGAAILWGIPYLIGRLYLTSNEAFKKLAVALFIGGLIYMPLCWIEIRFSPLIHRLVYGFFQHSFLQHARDGGYRPAVFMQSGLMVAFWMAAATICGFWLWRGKYIKQVLGVPVFWLVVAMASTTVLCKSLNAIGVLFAGTAFFYVWRTSFAKLAIIGLLCLPIAWVGLRASGLLSGEIAVEFVSVMNEERARSLSARMIQEDLFGAKARQRPLFGWGAWMRMFPTDENGKRLTRGVDGLWLIMFGKLGLAGLVSFLALLLLGPLSHCFRESRRAFRAVESLPLALFSVIAALYAEDCLFNGMVNPLFLMSAAGFVGVTKASLDSELDHLFTETPVMQ